MHTIAIIPARGSSKRIPNKNLLPLGGIPLIAHTIQHALLSKQIDRVFVSTDSNEIADVAKEDGVEVIVRPAELSGDTATSESALVHVLDELQKRGEQEPEAVVFLQCTSPVRKADDIDNAIDIFINEKADSLFSATRNYGLIWSSGSGGLRSLTYDYHCRKREQEMEKQFRENGSIYVVKPHILREQKNRLGGKIALYEMDFLNSFQVDTQEDISLIEFALTHYT